jgi:hypothetical protein
MRGSERVAQRAHAPRARLRARAERLARPSPFACRGTTAGRRGRARRTLSSAQASSLSTLIAGPRRTLMAGSITPARARRSRPRGRACRIWSALASSVAAALTWLAAASRSETGANPALVTYMFAAATAFASVASRRACGSGSPARGDARASALAETSRPGHTSTRSRAS